MSQNIHCTTYTHAQVPLLTYLLPSFPRYFYRFLFACLPASAFINGTLTVNGWFRPAAARYEHF